MGSFNVRGITEDTKKEQLVRDIAQYGVDVCALQETKISEAGVHNINENIIITFDSTNKHYGNGFVVSKKWQKYVYKYWRESDRICVLQLAGSPDTPEVKPQYECKLIDCRIEINKAAMKPKNIINIINVYTPTSERAKKCPKELKKLYKNLNKLCKELDKVSLSNTILAGDFNSKVGKRIGSESCIGQWSRGRRNQNGIDLVEFCENNGKIIANSCFQHPAKHITTWSQKRTNPVTNKTISIYN